MRLILSAIAFGAVLTMAYPSSADEYTTSYSVRPGTCKYPIPVPVDNKPIIVTIAHLSGGNVPPYLDAAIIMHIPGNDPTFLWGWGGGSAVGTEILCVAQSGSPTCLISLQIGDSDQLRLCNVKTDTYGTAVGKITLMY